MNGNTLHGISILRLVRGYAGGAGLEYDVAAIDAALCARYEIEIIRIHMARPGDRLTPSNELLGKGRVTNIPLEREVLPAAFGKPPANVYLQYKKLLNWLLFNPVAFSLFRGLIDRRLRRLRPGDIKKVAETMQDVISSRKVDLVVIHAAGGSDVTEAIRVAQQNEIPSAIQLHFANERFLDFSVRAQVRLVDGVAGVSDVRLPRYLRNRFANMLTGIDHEFFSLRPPSVKRDSERPLLALPARIVPTKGHDDMLKIARILRDDGLDVDIVFAGRADQPDYEADLKRRIAAANLTSRIRFLGLLNPEELREVYSRCTLVPFPTYHQEGLPRTILEAQSMELPVVAYDTGGTRAGIVPGLTGFVVNPGDISGMVSHIRSLLINPIKRQKMGRAARENIIANFSLTALADRHEAFYLSLLNRGNL
jgi:glycosyltransferase involved in cell wall biosynthesis